MSDTRTKILDSASNLFLEGGAAALSVRAISKRAGLSTIGIYSHFQGKQGILDTLYIEGFNMVYDAMKMSTDEKPGFDSIMLACDGYLTVATDHEAHYRLIFGEGGMDYTPSEEARAAADRAFGKLVSHTGEFIDAAGLEAEHMQTAMDMWALLHGYVSISHHTRVDPNWKWKEMALGAVSRYVKALV